MFSSALKSFSSNISANYSLAPEATSVSGPWKIFDAKKKSTGKAASVFVFDRKSLEPSAGGFASRSTGATLKRVHDEVIERLKKEASSLARLRHPSILELAEPVEETRSGGLIFATEPVTASLGGLLQEKDVQERAGGIGGRSSRYVVEDPEGGGRKRREVEIDELEIQKGLLQIAKGLEFLHESAGLVHANLTPEAVFVNAKSDWKISGLGFCSPADSNATNTSVVPIALSEVLNNDSRLPRSVQLNMDYTSPDLVLDHNMNVLADMFSLGLLIIALYNSPHRSPLDTSQSQSQFKKLFASSSSIPSKSNNFLSSQPLPKDILSDLLPRLITRRPAQRVDSRGFQQAKYFDNILVSTIRFLDSLPAKSYQEKSSFMRGLPSILPQFPKSVLEKKLLPVLLDQMKDRDLLPATLQNVFQVVRLLPGGKRTFSEKVIPKLREIFLAQVSTKSSTQERDSFKEGGLTVILKHMTLITENCTGKEFKDDILPIINLSLESPTHNLVVASLETLPIILPILDFTTIKNDLFPIVATVFSKTSSMNIKIQGLEALKVLCGGLQASEDDSFDMNPTPKQSTSSSSVLDKYTMQEKVIPLIRAIKTREPAVMMAALGVFEQVGKVADIEFLAADVLPCLWQFSLGPLLDLQQFKAFMTLIKSLSTRIENEQMRKLHDTSTGSMANGRSASNAQYFNAAHNSNQGMNSDDNDDFESLVTGRRATSGLSGTNMMDSGWDDTLSSRPAPAPHTMSSQQRTTQSPTFSWSSSNEPQKPTSPPALQPTVLGSRAVTPDVSARSLSSMAQTSAYTQPLQPQRAGSATLASLQAQSQQSQQSRITGSGIDWSSSGAGRNPWSSLEPSTPSFAASSAPSYATSNFSIPPPPLQATNVWSTPAPANAAARSSGGQASSGKSGLDKYESLL